MATEARNEQPEADDAAPSATQPPLFEVTGRSAYAPQIAGVGALGPSSPLPVAAYWFKRYLVQSQHPHNTVESYLYDLRIFEQVVGPKPIDQVVARMRAPVA